MDGNVTGRGAEFTHKLIFPSEFSFEKKTKNIKIIKVEQNRKKNETVVDGKC